MRVFYIIWTSVGLFSALLIPIKREGIGEKISRRVLPQLKNIGDPKTSISVHRMKHLLVHCKEWENSEFIKEPEKVKRVQEELEEAVGMNVVGESHLLKSAEFRCSCKGGIVFSSRGTSLGSSTCKCIMHSIPNGGVVVVDACQYIEIHNFGSHWSFDHGDYYFFWVKMVGLITSITLEFVSAAIA